MRVSVIVLRGGDGEWVMSTGNLCHVGDVGSFPKRHPCHQQRVSPTSARLPRQRYDVLTAALTSTLSFPAATLTAYPASLLSHTSGMEEEGLPFGYTHRQQKVSAGGTKKPSETG